MTNYPDHAIRDGHAMRIVIEDEYVGLHLVCPWDENDDLDGACRVDYSEDGQEVEGAPPLPYCNLREHLGAMGQEEAIILPCGAKVEITQAPFPIAWWWVALDECFAWAPDVTHG